MVEPVNLIRRFMILMLARLSNGMPHYVLLPFIVASFLSCVLPGVTCSSNDPFLET